MSKCDFNKVTKQLYWNHTSACVFSFKFQGRHHWGGLNFVVAMRSGIFS